jgi:hypothetical protein
VPFSYAQYAGNGSTTTFSVPFPYLLKAHVKLYTGFNILTGAFATQLVDGVDYTWTSGTQVQTTSAPATGVTLTVIRDTPDNALLVPWQDGSNLVADDLNSADLQNLYVVQEQQDRNDAGASASVAATAAATAATTAANAATAASNTATSTANTASSNASAALSTANTASADASAAVATANAASATAGTASTSASAAVTTANAASAAATAATTTANAAASDASTALSTANTASSNASTALSTANAASAAATNAVTTANTASGNASTALSTANTASSNASTALSTANTANNKADQAIAAVSNSINFQLKANVAAIPASPANDTYIEVQDSTGLESFTPLAGKPAGFVGDAGLSVRLRYTSAGSTWNWLNYYANNSETRYLKLTGGTLTGNITLAGAPSSNLHPATKAYVDGYVSAINGDIGFLSSTKLDSTTAASTYQTLAGMSSYLTTANAASTYQTQAGMSSYLTTSAAGSTYAPLASPTFTGTVTIPAGASISGYLTSATAASTYQTQAGMSSYLTTSAAGSTYAPLASPTFTGTVTIPAGASISGYAALATAQTFTSAQRGAISALGNQSGTITLDMATANNWSLTLNANSTNTLANPSNLTAGQSGCIYITQDGTGSRTLAYGSNWDFAGGTAPTLSTAANAVDVLVYAVRTTGSIAAQLIKDVK